MSDYSRPSRPFVCVVVDDPDELDGYGEHVVIDDPTALQEIRALSECLGCRARSAEATYLLGVINKLRQQVDGYHKAWGDIEQMKLNARRSGFGASTEGCER
jgi:hypothetical protein